jgi:hypothetical protein
MDELNESVFIPEGFVLVEERDDLLIFIREE